MPLPADWVKTRRLDFAQLVAQADARQIEAALRLLAPVHAAAAGRAPESRVLEAWGQWLGADRATVLVRDRAWRAEWSWPERQPSGAHELAAPLLNEAMDRQAAGTLPPLDGRPALLFCPLEPTLLPNRLVLAPRARPFDRADLEAAALLAPVLTEALAHTHELAAVRARSDRLESLLEVARQLAVVPDTATLLERIASHSTRLLGADRASIFLWDRARRQVVARPALGVPGGELRLADNFGVVGDVLQTGQPAIVNDVRSDPRFGAAVDKRSGYQTRSLLCVPLVDPGGQRVGVFEVLNKVDGEFTDEDRAALELLGAHVAAAIESARERENLLRTNAQLTDEARSQARIIGLSPAIVVLRKTVERVAATDLPVLIQGESGTGKEVVARAIHYGGPRRDRPFIAVNCAAIAETLLESELFGHERGAFTDAREMRAGKFELASGGTLFLDEIGDMSAGGQAKLLRVLEEKIVYRVGGSQPIPADARIIAATNRNLADAVASGKFRQDLFFRLTVVTIDLPPLRERQDDTLLLADHFLEQFCRGAGRPTPRISAEARKRLIAHAWPGNVRELRNLMERLAFLHPGPTIEPDDLAFILMPTRDGDRFDLPPNLGLAEATDHFQRSFIDAALARTRGNQAEAARLLGLHRSNLYRKMRQLGIES